MPCRARTARKTFMCDSKARRTLRGHSGNAEIPCTFHRSPCGKLLAMLDTPSPTSKPYADGKILQHVSGGIGSITFNNPDKRNAMSLEMWEGFGDALAELRDDDAVRVVILAGAGDKAFVSGA